MLKSNLITIAIPVFERKDFFEEALLSAINQTIKCKIIVVDNNSSHDFFRDICKKYEVIYYKNETNIGMFANWNKCFELAKTEFVMILGDDDILELNYVSFFQDALTKHSDIDIFFSNFEILDNNTKTIYNHRHTLPFGYMNNGKKVIEYGILYRLGFPVISSVIRKDKFNGFYEYFHGSNDWAWIYENVEMMVVYGETTKLLLYRNHNKNDTKNQKTIINCYVSILYIYKKLLNQYLNNTKLKTKLKENIIQTNIFIYTHVEREYLISIINHNNRYSILLKENYNFIINLFLFLPLKIRKLTYSLIRKFGLVR